MTIVETRPITGGVDTHLDVHVAAALDANGGVLGVESFATTPDGFADLHAWLVEFGPLERVGVEGIGASFCVPSIATWVVVRSRS